MGNQPEFYISRRCTETGSDQSGNISTPYYPDTKTLADYRDRSAYVLLGDPGAGKTFSFRHEAQETGCQYVKARDFICNIDIGSTWQGKTLFIDGLDEVRAGSNNGLIPLDAIRKRLIDLGRPRFRLSCREADWLGATDTEDLKQMASDNTIITLHLTPLAENEIREIVRHDSPSLDIDEFIDWANKHSLIALLSNPQLLILMVRAVAGDKRPENRTQTYELACQEIVNEQNREHQQAGKSKYFAPNRLVDSAGKLFAHQLISGMEGYSLSILNEDSSHPYYHKIFSDDLELIEGALKTNLFKPGNLDEQREPLHRSVAEFLAANYLAGLVANYGLPVGRVLSLITASDGGLITSLRGLFAWLVTLCTKERDILLTRDPLGIVLYGDVNSFTKEQKIRLLKILHEEAKQYTHFRSENWTSSPFGALATADMEVEFKNIIETARRSKPDQVLVDIVIDAMAYGISYPKLEHTLWDMVTDHTWWPGIRKEALKILLRDYLDDPEKNKQFIALLDKINMGSVEDRDDSLAGKLLTHLYPAILPAPRIMSYYHYPKDNHLIGGYHYFWNHTLIEKSTKEDIAVLLDVLAYNEELKNTFQKDYRSCNVLREALLKGLNYWGDTISDSRLYSWLGVGLDKYGSSRSDSTRGEEQQQSIHQWLSERPDRYKAVLLEGARRYGDSSKKKWHTYDIYSRLYLSQPPSNMGPWYLEQAAIQNNTDIADEFFRRAMFSLYNNETSAGFNLDSMGEWVNNHPQFRVLFDSMLFDPDIESRIEHATRKIERNTQDKKRIETWISEFTKRKAEIKQGTAAPGLYQDLAFTYYGHFHEAEGDTPHERLHSLFSGHSDLYEIALEGLINTINRTDLPTVKEIIDTHVKGKRFNIHYGVLAGMDEIFTHSANKLKSITDQQYKHALAFQFTESTEDPEWLKFLIKTRPDLVSEVYIQLAVTSLKAGKNSVTGIYQLAYDKDWLPIVYLTVLPILEQYPVRAKKEQISDLDYLIKAAMRYVKTDLLKLIDKKRQLGSMNIVQHSRWLTAGLLLSPGKYQQPFCDFLENNAARIQMVAGFLTDRIDQWHPDYDKLPEKTIGLFIRYLGSHFTPHYRRISGSYSVTHNMDVADQISAYINILSGKSNKAVTEQLEYLLNLPELGKWKESIQGALYRQRKIVRDKTFLQPDIKQVSQTLKNLEPANPADLMVLTLSHLEDLALRIRDGSTDDYKQYWNTDGHGKITAPKIENICRDTLLSDLKQLLASLKINASKEGDYADNNRADIKVTYGGFNVPVEIKRASHKDLWTALWRQLIEKYSRDPGAYGYGIYLIFWFGTDKIPLPPNGKKPKSASELKQALWNMMSLEERRMIGLCVIDCSINQQRKNI